MKKAIINWKISNSKIETVERYCHNCGKKVIFTDSLKRRQNANGKNLYNFAIFKCENGHTWNKMLGICNSTKDDTEKESPEIKECISDLSIEPVYLETYKKLDCTELEIIIEAIYEKTRLDKLLSTYIADLSRSAVKKLIKEGRILVDNLNIDSDFKVSKGNIVKIIL